MDKEPDRKQNQKKLNKFSLRKQINNIYIISLVSKVCCDSLRDIRNKAGFGRIKQGMVNVDNYAMV